MILLDTDHITVLKNIPGARRDRLLARIEQAFPEIVGTTVVTVEEQMRGWLAVIARERTFRRQIAAYRELAVLFKFFAPFEIALFDEAAADRLDELRAGKVRVGRMDLKIAAIALANNALLLTANRQDFERIPNLRFENWLD